MKKVIVSELARSDLDEIWAYIAEDNTTAADNFAERVVGLYRLLADNPRMGRERKDLQQDLHSFPIGKYTVFYRPVEDGVEIVRVVSGYRDVPSLF